jgi:hypothetical protein
MTAHGFMKQRFEPKRRDRIARDERSELVIGICVRNSPSMRVAHDIANTDLSPLQGSLSYCLSQGFASLTPGYSLPALRAWGSIFARSNGILPQPWRIQPALRAWGSISEQPFMRPVAHHVTYENLKHHVWGRAFSPPVPAKAGTSSLSLLGCNQ